MLDIPVDDPLIEAAISASGRGIAALFNDAVTGMAIVDPEFRFRYANPAMCRMLGRPLEDILGRSSSEVTHPDDLPRTEALMASLEAGIATSDQARKRYLHPDGTVTWVLRSTTALRDGAGRIVGLFTQAVDITEVVQAQESLRRSERRFRSIVGSSWDVVALHDAAGRSFYCSPAIKAQLGYDPEELVGARGTDIVHPDDTCARDAFFQVASGAANELTTQYRVRNKGGQWRWIESSFRNHLDDPAISSVVVTSRDVTDRRRRSAQHDAIAELSSAALKGGPIEHFLEEAVGVIARGLGSDTCSIIGEDGNGELRVLVRAGAAVVDGPLPDIVHSSIVSEAIRLRKTMLYESGVNPGRHGYGLRSGVAAVIDSDREPPSVLLAVSKSDRAFSRNDVSFLEAAANVLAAAENRYRMEQELRRQALHDDLTGLPNRSLLLDRLEHALGRLARHPGQVAALFVDLDNFKLVNDGLGHTAGDRLVSAIARRLVQAIRETDTVARFGGDEFVVISEDTDDASVTALAERIREAVCEPLDLDGRMVTITASIGYASTSTPGSSADDLLSRADTAMYAAKAAGKDCAAAFTPAMRAEVTDHLEAISGLRRALAGDEFRLVYQPVVDAVTGADIRSEALLRWDHPTDGETAPGAFIDYAETSGLIVPIGEWVLRTAATQSAAWRRDGRLSEVAINISGRQLMESDIVASVRSALEQSGARPEDLFLEVTETALMADMDRAVAAVQALRELGVHVGMDDFGTGHSSLSQLARLPVDFIKIDRSFILDLDRSERTGAMLEAILALCRALDLPAVAEGVETEAQLERVRAVGVPYIQGYLFGRPSPPADLERRGWRPT